MTSWILAAVVVVVFRRFGAFRFPWRRRRVDVVRELAELCDLVVIGLTGGLNTSTSLRIAAGATGGVIAGDVERILATARIDGLGRAMAAASGRGVRLYQTVSRADGGGGPMLQPVQALADELWAERATAAVERARKLPVAMLLPLTLLILPGFLLLTIAPAVLEAFSRLEL